MCEIDRSFSRSKPSICELEFLPQPPPSARAHPFVSHHQSCIITRTMASSRTPRHATRTHTSHTKSSSRPRLAPNANVNATPRARPPRRPPSSSPSRVRVPGITHPHRGGVVAMSYSTITRRALARGAHRRTVASPRRSASTHDRARPMRVPGYIHMVYRGYIHTPTHRASKRRRGRRRTVARATERRWR